MDKKGFRGQRNENGRPKGAVNKTTAETKALIQKIVSEELEYLPLYLDTLSPKDRLELVVKLISFVVPKQSQAQIDLQAEIVDRFTPVIIQMNEPLKQIENEPNTD